MAAHLGEADENRIDNMSFIFFEDVLAELNCKLTYDAIANYAGNSFMEKSWDLITEHHPFFRNKLGGSSDDKGQPKPALQQLAKLFGG